MKRKEPYVNLSWPIYILFVVVGCVLAKVLFDELDVTELGANNLYVFDALVLVYGFISCILFYQLGKLIFSKIAGFDVIYFNLFLIGWRKENGKTKAYFGGKEGFSVKVEIVPKPGKKANYYLAYWGGTITTLLIVGIEAALVFILNASAVIKAFFILSAIFYPFAIIAYMLPVKMDSINDGFTLMLLRKYKLQDTLSRNKRNLQALYDSSKELEYFDYEDLNDPLSMDGKIYNYFYAIKKGDRELLNKIAQDISENHKFVVSDEFNQIAIICQMYTLCLTGNKKEISDLYWKLDSATRKFVRNPKNLNSYKAGLYIAGLVDDSKQSFYEIYDRLEEAKARYHYPALVEAEVDLINKIKEEVCAACNNWEDPVDNVDYTNSSFTQQEQESVEKIEDEQIVTISSLDEEEK